MCIKQAVEVPIPDCRPVLFEAFREIGLCLTERLLATFFSMFLMR